MSVPTTLGQVVYTLPKIADAGDPPCTNDTWTATTTANAPVARVFHTAVWTGREMIVWGGQGNGFPLHFSTPAGDTIRVQDSWAATSTTNAPSAREEHTAVWTGSEIIIWGGGDGPLNTGGRYNPSTDSWTATSTTNAPTARGGHTAVWTGSEMIVWGGENGGGVVNTGGRYCAQSGPTPTPTSTPTPTASPTPTPTPTPCTGRCSPTPRPRPSPAPRP